MQLLELREENARLRERLRHYEPLPDSSRKSSGTGEGGGPLQQQASAPPPAGGTAPPSAVPSQLSM